MQQIYLHYFSRFFWLCLGSSFIVCRQRKSMKIVDFFSCYSSNHFFVVSNGICVFGALRLLQHENAISASLSTWQIFHLICQTNESTTADSAHIRNWLSHHLQRNSLYCCCCCNCDAIWLDFLVCCVCWMRVVVVLNHQKAEEPKNALKKSAL